MSKYVKLDVQNGIFEVPMDADARHYRDILSPSMQGMVDNGGYVLLNEQGQAVDIDGELPQQKDETGPPLLRLRPITLPKIWVGYYQDLIERPLFCFLTKDKAVAEKMEAPVRCFTHGGFTVARFTDEDRLRDALDDPEYLGLFDMVGLVADPSAIESLWRIRKELVAQGRLNGKKTPFACACYCGMVSAEVQEPTLENGMVPATVDLSLEPEPFCEQMIYTLYYDDRWPLPAAATNGSIRHAGQQVPAICETLVDAFHLEDRAFYSDMSTHYTDFLRDFVRQFKNTLGWPASNLIQRLISKDQYLSRSRLARDPGDTMLRCFKKVLDLGRCVIASPPLPRVFLTQEPQPGGV